MVNMLHAPLCQAQTHHFQATSIRSPRVLQPVETNVCHDLHKLLQILGEAPTLSVAGAEARGVVVMVQLEGTPAVGVHEEQEYSSSFTEPESQGTSQSIFYGAAL
ncbi:Dihydroxy-acid dehydratase chloroplastic [Sesbania bispinosa]|nr:Dihydroxy-acid dehydratase chloroplastic [Sesbania bispinosa]